MNRIAMALVAISTAIMFAIILALAAWAVASLVSDSAGKALFIVLWTAALAIPAAWLGMRIGNRLAKQSRDYAEKQRNKGK